MFAHYETVSQFLLWPQMPPRVLGFCNPHGLVHFLVTGGLEIFPGWMVAISGNSSLQCGFLTLVLIVMIYHCQCEVSHR